VSDVPAMRPASADRAAKDACYASITGNREAPAWSQLAEHDREHFRASVRAANEESPG